MEERSPNDSRWRGWLSTSLAFLFLFGWMEFARPYVVQEHVPFLGHLVISTPLFMLWLLIYIYLSILIHELGHLLGAIASGFKLNFLTVARFVLIQKQGGFKLRRMQKMSAGGLTSTIPTSHHHLHKKLMILIAGGPLASFLLFLIGPVLLPFPAFFSSNSIVLMLVMSAGFNLYVAITNSLPLKIGFHTTDGYLLSAIARKTIPGRRFLAMYEYLAELAQGVRPRELSNRLIKTAIAHPEKSMHHGYGLIMAYYQALDSGHIDQAGTFLDEALAIKDYIPEYVKASLFMEAAYFEAFHRQSPTTAHNWLGQITEFVFIESYTKFRTEAAIALAEGKSKEAHQKAKQGLDAIYVNSLAKGMAIAEQDWLNQILSQSTSI